MAKDVGIKPLELLKKRREEAKKMGRLIHPEPLIAEVRKRRKRILKIKILTPVTVLVDKSLEFIEGVSRIIRNPANWESATAGVIMSNVISKVIGRG